MQVIKVENEMGLKERVGIGTSPRKMQRMAWANGVQRNVRKRHLTGKGPLKMRALRMTLRSGRHEIGRPVSVRMWRKRVE